MNLTKLSSTAKKLDTFFKVLQKIVSISMIVLFCVLTALTVVHFVVPDAVIGTDLNTLDLGPVTIELAEQYTPSNGGILAYVWIYSIPAAICAAAVWFGLRHIRKVLAPMAEGSPFHPDTALHLKKLAYLSLVLGVVQNVGAFLETHTALRTFGLDRLTDSGVIRSLTVNYTLEMGFLVAFFLLLLMSYLFSYGAELQKLSDETL